MNTSFFKSCACIIACFIPFWVSVIHADDSVAAGPPLTTKWVPDFKEGVVTLHITNMGNTPFQFEPTPIILTSPSEKVDWGKDAIPPEFPFTERDVITPSITIIGSGFNNNIQGAGNGRKDLPITIQSKESKAFALSYNGHMDFNIAQVAANCIQLILSLHLNGAEIYHLSMKRDIKGVWSID